MVSGKDMVKVPDDRPLPSEDRTIVSDDEILAMLAEKKNFPDDFNLNTSLGHMHHGRSSDELDILARGEFGRNYTLKVRINRKYPDDFMVGIFTTVYGVGIFRLRRYDSNSHEHRNHLEKNAFLNFHIHMATERYQTAGLKEDAYAEATDRFIDLHGAIRCALQDGNFVMSQGHLFMPDQ